MPRGGISKNCSNEKFIAFDAIAILVSFEVASDWLGGTDAVPVQESAHFEGNRELRPTCRSYHRYLPE
jgi:hypothetical protein